MKQSSDANTSGSPRVSIVGMGYVGMATAVCFANQGFRVYGVEVDKRKCAMIQSGLSPIHEEGIDSGLQQGVESGALTCDSDVQEAVLNTETTFLTVGTPSSADGSIDLRYIESAARAVGTSIKNSSRHHNIVVKSTVVPGTTLGLVRRLLEETSGKSYPSDFGLCFNPEFLREGTAVYDTLHPDAVVVGADDNRASEDLLSLYAQFYQKGHFPSIITSISNAELVKYAVNSFRATQLSFLNSLANLCEKIPSSDIVEVAKGLSAITKMDERYLRAGLGYGGSCLPKDLRALTAIFERYQVNSSILRSTADVNHRQPLRAVEITDQLLGGLRGKKICVLGLTFKAGTDDVRESVAMRIVGALLNSGTIVKVFDPIGMENAGQTLGTSVEYASTAKSCLEGMDACIIATGWSEFRQIPASVFKTEMAQPILVDGCRLFDVEEFRSNGVTVYQLGRNNVSTQKLEAEQFVGVSSSEAHRGKV